MQNGQPLAGARDADERVGLSGHEVDPRETDARPATGSRPSARTAHEVPRQSTARTTDSEDRAADEIASVDRAIAALEASAASSVTP